MDREAAWDLTHDRLPPRWRVGPRVHDPATRRWLVVDAPHRHDHLAGEGPLTTSEPGPEHVNRAIAVVAQRFLRHQVDASATNKAPIKVIATPLITVPRSTRVPQFPNSTMKRPPSLGPLTFGWGAG
jgi:hypothetical protein